MSDTPTAGLEQMNLALATANADQNLPSEPVESAPAPAAPQTAQTAQTTPTLLQAMFLDTQQSSMNTTAI